MRGEARILPTPSRPQRTAGLPLSPRSWPGGAVAPAPHLLVQLAPAVQPGGVGGRVGKEASGQPGERRRAPRGYFHPGLSRRGETQRPGAGLRRARLPPSPPRQRGIKPTATTGLKPSCTTRSFGKAALGTDPAWMALANLSGHARALGGERGRRGRWWQHAHPQLLTAIRLETSTKGYVSMLAKNCGGKQGCSAPPAPPRSLLGVQTPRQGLYLLQ